MKRTSTGCTRAASSCRARRSVPTGCATASSPGIPAPDWSPACAARRRTTGRTSASAVAGSRCPGPGPARPCASISADRAAVVREVLAEAGIEAPEADRMAADVLRRDGLPRYVWETMLVDAADYVDAVMARSGSERWRRSTTRRNRWWPVAPARALTGLWKPFGNHIPAASRQPAIFGRLPVCPG